jgi:hypothetical protein
LDAESARVTGLTVPGIAAVLRTPWAGCKVAWRAFRGTLIVDEGEQT